MSGRSSTVDSVGLGGSRRRALVIGASGMVGAGLSRALHSHYEVTGTSFSSVGGNCVRLDVRDRDAVDRCVAEIDPDLVVLCAAASNVAACEADPQGSAAVNYAGAVNVARSVDERALVFFSSDAVFSNARPQWSEADPADPRSAYGRQKASAEKEVLTCVNHLIIRTARLYGLERGDGRFIDFVIRTLTEGGDITAPVDTPGNPTLLEDLCAATATLLLRKERGVWNLAGPPVASLFHTAREVAEILDLDRRRVHPVSRDHASALPRICARLDTSKAAAAGLRLRSLREGLELIRIAQRG